jgi:O-antigen ligase
MKLLDKLIKYGLWLLVFLLPWQTRWIYQEAYFKNEVFEYGRLSLYGTEIILIAVLCLGLFSHISKRRGNQQQFINDFKAELKSFWLPVFLLAVWSAMAISWSPDKQLAWYVWLKLAEGIGLFWLINKFPISNFKFQISNILIASGLIQAILGIYQFLTQSTFAFKWLGLALNKTEGLGTSVVEFGDERWLRAYGSLPHPNIFGGFLAVCLILVILNLWRLNRQLADQESVAKKYYYLNLFYWLSLILIGFGLIISFSRSAWLGSGLVFIFLFLWPFFKKARVERIVNLKVATAFIMLAVMFLVSFPSELITTRFKGQTRLERLSLIERQASLEQSQEILRTNWYKGVGPGNYLIKLQQFQPDLHWWQFQPVHNIYLIVLAELGIVGLVLFVLIIIFILRKRSEYWPLLFVLLLIALFDHYLWTLYFGTMLWWLVLAFSYKTERLED